jgi:uncharacterized cysteine cluster protein YcgN (CxxCxxCC family)
MTRAPASIAEAPLDALDSDEWEQLCDGCARCCLHKLQDQDTDEVYYTDIACPLLDTEACRCTDYPHRAERIAACLQLTPESVPHTPWLPATCAYRLRALGKPLPRWHYLRSGNWEDVHRSGASIRGKAAHVENPDDELLKSRIVEMVKTDTGVRLYFTPDAPLGDD